MLFFGIYLNVGVALYFIVFLKKIYLILKLLLDQKIVLKIIMIGKN